MAQILMIAEDVMFVSGIDFLVSVSCGIKLTTVEYMPKRTAPVISKYLKKVYDIYLRRSFTVNLFLTDH